MDVIAVTNRKLCTDFYKRIEALSKINLKYLILREKDLSYEELLDMAIRVKSILDKGNVKLIINSNIRVAEKIKAYGVQLPFKLFMEQDYSGVKGVSIHSIEEGIKAEKHGADYLIYGHLFQTECKKGLKPKGLEELKEICKVIKIPVYGIGGINKNNYSLVMKTGVRGVALMSTLFK